MACLTHHAGSVTCARMSRFPWPRAPRWPTPSFAATSARPPPRSGPNGPRWSRSCRTGRTCAPPGRRSSSTRWRTWMSTWSNWSARSPRAAGPGLGQGRLRGAAPGGQPGPGDRRDRGRQGQVDRHRRDRPQRGAGKAGITAHETDLAELIVQLGHDRPSHILVPAIHRTAPRSGRSSARDARRGPGADRHADRARRGRPALPAAQVPVRRVGISGANFAVAETGTLCVVESEGNGRMCLTLPETLITVMGIEKVIPSWHDWRCSCNCCPARPPGSG